MMATGAAGSTKSAGAAVRSCIFVGSQRAKWDSRKQTKK